MSALLWEEAEGQEGAGGSGRPGRAVYHGLVEVEGQSGWSLGSVRHSVVTNLDLPPPHQARLPKRRGKRDASAP